MRVLKEEIAEYTRQQIYQLCRQKDHIRVLELTIQTDHIHLVLSIPPKYAMSNVIGYLKGKLALRLFNQYEYPGKRYWGRYLWARGCCVSTIVFERGDRSEIHEASNSLSLSLVEV